MEDGNRFWYAQGGGGRWSFYEYDPVRKKRAALLDTSRVRSALAKIAGHDLPGTELPFNSITLGRGEHVARFLFEGHRYVLQRESNEIQEETAGEADRLEPRLLSKPAIVGPSPVYELRSPDGRWYLGAADDNLYLRSATDGHTETLTTDASKEFGWAFEWYTVPLWSPDSRWIAVKRTDRRKRQESLYPVVHWLKAVPEVEWAPYQQKAPATECYIVDVGSHERVRIEGNPVHFRGWLTDSSELLVTRIEAQKLEMVAVNAKTGATRPLFTETTKTFFDTAVTAPYSPNSVVLQASRQFLWLSERDGWNEIYLYGTDGRLVRQLTTGRRPVERIVAVDEKNGWVYFTAHGGDRRRYDFQLYRVNLAGGPSVLLTDAPGQHDQPLYVTYQGARGEGIQFAPSRQFFLDTHSDIDRPPGTDVRRADGSLVEVLAKVNAEAAHDVMPHAPEPFTALASDGQTELDGVLYKPYDFDPSKKYPLVDFIYGGPQMTRVPRTFAADSREQALANMGMVLVVLDARGTPARGKAFQDVAYGSMGRYVIPDHVAAMKQLTANRPYLDSNRVAVLGGSIGGYFAARAMLEAPEVYQVGVAMAPVYELRDGAGALWTGSAAEKLKDDAESNLLKRAGDLRGRLLIIHGTSDLNAPLGSTIRMIDALERANKPYDLVLLPEMDHTGQNSPYSLQSVRRYLAEHLSLGQ
jgi:dipeptidyl-peptidase-4